MTAPGSAMAAPGVAALPPLLLLLLGATVAAGCGYQVGPERLGQGGTRRGRGGTGASWGNGDWGTRRDWGIWEALEDTGVDGGTRQRPGAPRKRGLGEAEGTPGPPGERGTGGTGRGRAGAPGGRRQVWGREGGAVGSCFHLRPQRKQPGEGGKGRPSPVRAP